MKINLLFFGRLAEVVNDQQDIMLDEKSTADQLKNILLGKFPDLEQYTYRLAVNEKIINTDRELQENDVVAFMPPFAGG